MVICLVSAAAAVVAIAGISFGLYHANVADKMTTLANEKAELADEKTQLADEILEEYKLKQENQSRFFAKEALSLMNEGNREDATLVAIAGLPGPLRTGRRIRLKPGSSRLRHRRRYGL